MEPEYPIVLTPPPTAEEIGITDEDFEEFVRVVADMHPGYA